METIDKTQLKKAKRKALNFVFEELKNHNPGGNIKNTLIDIIDGAIYQIIRQSSLNTSMFDVQDELLNLCHLKEMIKMA